MLGLAESEASGVLNPTSTAALISGIICLCLVATAADAARQIHVAQVFARCLDDQGGKKQETKLMASMVKSCEENTDVAPFGALRSPRIALRTRSDW